MLLHHGVECFHARQRTLDAQFQQVVGEQPATAAAAEGGLVRGARRHVVEVVGAGPDDLARDLELPTRQLTHA